MQQTFDTYATCDANENAVAWCRRIASLEEEFDGPIVLQGGPLVGKSHLLWAIVEEVRASGRDAALVLISAQNFPDRVKSLITRPTPIQTPRPALLLVDDLQEFDEDAGDLEAVVTCFLENGHNVVLATNISPQFLHSFSVGFRQLLTQGEKVVVGKRSVASDQPMTTEPDVISRLRAECEALINERLALQQELEKHRTRVVQVESAEARMFAAEDARARSDAQAEQAVIEMQIAQTREREAHTAREAALDEAHQLRREMEALRRERDGLHAAREALRKRLTRLTQATDAASRFESDLQRMQDDRDRLRLEHAQLTEQLKMLTPDLDSWRARAERAEAQITEGDTARESLEERVRALEGLEEAAAELRRERDAARRAVRHLAEQSQALSDQLDSTSGDESALQEAVVVSLKDFLVSVTALAGDWPAARPGEIAGALSDSDDAPQGVDALRSEYNQVSGLYEESRAEQGRLSVAFEATRGRLGRVEFEFAKARKTQSFLVAEMESLRREAAAQVATANMQAGELEHGISAVAVLLEQWRNLKRNDAIDPQRLQRDLASAVRHLHDMADKVAVLKREIAAGNVDDEPVDQGVLFEPDAPAAKSMLSIQEIGRSLDALSAPADPGHLSLADAVQQALSQDDPSGDIS